MKFIITNNPQMWGNTEYYVQLEIYETVSSDPNKVRLFDRNYWMKEFHFYYPFKYASVTIRKHGSNREFLLGHVSLLGELSTPAYRIHASVDARFTYLISADIFDWKPIIRAWNHPSGGAR